jgi:tetratricopeptide (TPR) repeat protein
MMLMLSLLASGSPPQPEISSTPEYVQEYNAGTRAQQEQKYSEAIEHYKNAIDQKSDLPDAWNNMGYCYRMTAKTYLIESGKAYDKAISYDPNHEKALEYQGEYFLMMGQFTNAYKNYRKLKQLNSSEAKILKSRLDQALEDAQSLLNDYSP